MPVLSRIEELRRRVQRDPASLVFAQLAEEHRRAGEHHEAVRVCRTGLRHHPEYHSARVTLGRALLALGQLVEAQRELEAVLQVAPENIAARRDLGEVYRRDERLPEALVQFRSALALAPQDEELAATVAELERTVPPPVAAAAGDATPAASASVQPALVVESTSLTAAAPDASESEGPLPDRAEGTVLTPGPPEDTASPGDAFAIEPTFFPAAAPEPATAVTAEGAPATEDPPVAETVAATNVVPATDPDPFAEPAVAEVLPATTQTELAPVKPQAERMLERLEGWLARLEADRRARDTDERGA